MSGGLNVDVLTVSSAYFVSTIFETKLSETLQVVALGR